MGQLSQHPCTWPAATVLKDSQITKNTLHRFKNKTLHFLCLINQLTRDTPLDPLNPRKYTLGKFRVISNARCGEPIYTQYPMGPTKPAQIYNRQIWGDFKRTPHEGEKQEMNVLNSNMLSMLHLPSQKKKKWNF